MVGQVPVLQKLLGEARLTYDAAATEVRRLSRLDGGAPLHTNRSAVSHWVNGAAVPYPRTAWLLCDVLSARTGRRVAPADLGYANTSSSVVGGGDPVDDAARWARGQLDRRAVLRGAAYSLAALTLPGPDRAEAYARGDRAADGGRVGAGEVAKVRALTADHNAVDELHGGRVGQTALATLLAYDVADYCRSATGPVRSAMARAASEMWYLFAWKFHDMGAEGRAQQAYLHSLQLAQEAGDSFRVAYVQRILAHQADDVGLGRYGIGRAEQALAGVTGRVDPHTEAIFTLTCARVYAAAGERQLAIAALGRADRLMDRSKPGDTRPDGSGFHGTSRGQYYNHSGHTLAQLGELGPAAERYATGLATSFDRQTKPRIWALTASWHAGVLARQGRLDEACASWQQGLDLMGRIQSERIRREVQKMIDAVSPFKARGSTAAAALESRARALLST